MPSHLTSVATLLLVSLSASAQAQQRAYSGPVVPPGASDVALDVVVFANAAEHGAPFLRALLHGFYDGRRVSLTGGLTRRTVRVGSKRWAEKVDQLVEVAADTRPQWVPPRAARLALGGGDAGGLRIDPEDLIAGPGVLMRICEVARLLRARNGSILGRCDSDPAPTQREGPLDVLLWRDPQGHIHIGRERMEGALVAERVRFVADPPRLAIRLGESLEDVPETLVREVASSPEDRWAGLYLSPSSSVRTPRQSSSRAEPWSS